MIERLQSASSSPNAKHEAKTKENTLRRFAVAPNSRLVARDVFLSRVGKLVGFGSS